MEEYIDKTYDNDLPYDHPDIISLRELNAKGFNKPFPFSDPDYMRRNKLGFYRNFNTVDDDESPGNWHSRKTACAVSGYIVGLSCSNGGEIPLSSSGIIVEYEGVKKILTSTYIFGGRSELLTVKADVFLPNGKTVCGSVSLADPDYNIVLIHAELDDTDSASLSTDFVNLGDEVLSLGLHPKYGLMACRGTIISRQDHLDSDDLMSCSCNISESGIGGPVIVQQSRSLIGINVYINKKASSFIPSCILAHYFEYLVTIGRVLRPWLGFKTRGLNEKKLVDLVALYREFPSFKGILVTEVTKGSPADRAGLCVDDIITSCNDIDLSSPIELADLLLKLGKSRLTRKAKGRPRVVEVVIQRTGVATALATTINFRDFTSPNVSRWPLVPFELSFNECEIVLYSSQVDDPKADAIWNPEKLQSKFTTWFHEEKSSMEKPGSLLSENDKNDGLNGVLAAPVSPPDILVWHKTSNAGSSTSSISGRVQKASVLTCESLKQSTLLEVAGNISKTHSFEKEEVTCKKEGLPDTHVESSASQHLHSLILGGTTSRYAVSTRDLAERQPDDNQELGKSSLPESCTTTFCVREPSHSDRTRTRETSFRTSFVTEVHSAHKNSVASAQMDVPDGGLFAIKSGQNGGVCSHEGSILASNHIGENVEFSRLPYEADAKFRGFNGDIGVKPPEEDTLINLVDPINPENSSWAPNLGSCNADLWSLSSSTSVNVVRGSAGLDGSIEDERSMVGGNDPLILHDTCNMRKPKNSCPNQDAVIHRDAPMNHQFPNIMDRPNQDAGLSTFDHPIPPPVLQPMHMAWQSSST